MPEAFRDKRADAHILQAHGVEHTGGSLAQARRRGTFHRLEGKSFDDDAAEPVQIHEVSELDAVAKRTACGQNGIRKTQSADIDREIHGGGNGHAGDSSTQAWGRARCLWKNQSGT